MTRKNLPVTAKPQTAGGNKKPPAVTGNKANQRPSKKIIVKDAPARKPMKNANLGKKLVASETDKTGDDDERVEFNANFSFDLNDSDIPQVIKKPVVVAAVKSEAKSGALNKNERMNKLNQKIEMLAAAKKKKFEKEVSEGENEGEEEKEEEEEGSDLSDNELEGNSGSKKEATSSNYFDNSAKVLEQSEVDSMTFNDFNLSRPILKGLASMGFVKPTRIQASAIPVALMGKDICGGAVTGSGKTLAFLLPILERLQYRAKQVRASRVLILLPTRELAAQCHEVAVKLAQFTDISCSLIAGGLPMRPQEAELRRYPDIIIATPGRLIDHITNSPQFNLDGIEILVLDEADRMLEEGFSDELTKIIESCPTSTARQTILFSASMTENVDDLVRLSMRQPVKLFVDANLSITHKLTQEFVRIRETKEADRMAIILALCSRTFHTNCIIFLPTKDLCHRARVILGLAGLKVTELHGSLSQDERLASLESFKAGEVDYLVATDVAARGLDIQGVQTVVNYSMPINYKQYLHRVGRTARAGRTGKSVTLVGEADRKVLKMVMKNSTEPAKQRVIDQQVITEYREKLQELKVDVDAVLLEEKEEKLLKQAEMEAQRASNLIEHADEIKARPPKQWFQSVKEKAASKQKDVIQSGKRKFEGVKSGAKKVKKNYD